MDDNGQNYVLFQLCEFPKSTAVPRSSLRCLPLVTTLLQVITCPTSKQYRYNRLHTLYCKHLCYSNFTAITLHKSICKTFENGQILYCTQKELKVIPTMCFSFPVEFSEMFGKFSAGQLPPLECVALLLSCSNRHSMWQAWVHILKRHTKSLLTV